MQTDPGLTLLQEVLGFLAIWIIPCWILGIFITNREKSQGCHVEHPLWRLQFSESIDKLGWQICLGQAVGEVVIDPWKMQDWTCLLCSLAMAQMAIFDQSYHRVAKIPAGTLDDANGLGHLEYAKSIQDYLVEWSGAPPSDPQGWHRRKKNPV